MKLVASSKLLKAQRTIEALRPYEEQLSRILSSLPPIAPPVEAPEDEFAAESSKAGALTVVVAFAGNTSMCGAFNSNVIKLVLDTVSALDGPVEIWAFGRKMSDALRKAGLPAVRDYNHLVSAPSSSEVASISQELRDRFADGSVGRVLLVYNHFVSTGKQVPVQEQFLPFQAPERLEAEPVPESQYYYLLEPSAGELSLSLVPQVLDLKMYAALLDSVAAEHAARMVAMQAATDNAQDLLAELTLEYNKGRQQKITAEILDLVGGEVNS